MKGLYKKMWWGKLSDDGQDMIMRSGYQLNDIRLNFQGPV